MLQSDRFPCRDSAEAALGLFRAHCASTERYVKKISSGGKPFFKLKAGKEVILVSHLYDSEATLDNAISAIAAAGTTERVEVVQL
ncbi:YegP family protein [Pseudomonas sp. LD120]|uniref:YegP family protein n=1 Tax=Pseudomonas sp. LD120 TaxID=485751 RepID=UPI002115165D